jgi:hypothetical protein
MEMRRLKGIIFLVVSCLILSGCLQATGRVLKNTFLPDFTVIPDPQPGLVLPINRSPGVWAECWLFEGSFGERDLIIPHPTQRGRLTFAKPPIKRFVIDPPWSQPYQYSVVSSVITVPLLLAAYPADYTLLVFHQNFRDRLTRIIRSEEEIVIKARQIETRRFSTSGYALNNYYVSAGRRVYADRVIMLARVEPYERRQLRFHLVLYPGHALKDALGL